MSDATSPGNAAVAVPAARLAAILQPLRIRDRAAAGGVLRAAVGAGLLSGAQHRLD